jgi:hypothetical protein
MDFQVPRNGILGNWPGRLQSAVRYIAITREARDTESREGVAGTVSLRKPKCIIS